MTSRTAPEMQIPAGSANAARRRAMFAALHVDLGRARFDLNSNLFSGLLTVFGQSTRAIGRQVDPFDVRITSGVARFDDIKVPLGEFTCGSGGSIDLVHDSLDVLIWIPRVVFFLPARLDFDDCDDDRFSGSFETKRRVSFCRRSSRNQIIVQVELRPEIGGLIIQCRNA